MNFEHDLRSDVTLLHPPTDGRQQFEAAATVQPSLNAEATTLSQRFPRLARYRTLLIIGIALFLVWEIITRGMAAYLAAENPEAALLLRANQPTALTKLADHQLNSAPGKADQTSPQAGQPDSTAPKPAPQTTELGDERSAEQAFPDLTTDPSKDLDQIKAWAELAVRNDPLNARALRILGQLAYRAENKEQADALMQAAAARNLHESFALYWTMLKRYRDADYAEALRYADILLRTRSQAHPYVMPLVARLAETPEASEGVKQLLANNPPWRSQFFAYFPQGISDARTPLDVFLTLKDTPTPPTATDLRAYLDFLVQRGFHDLAYYAWLQFLPPEQLSKVGRLFNGNFQTAPSGLPFDWVFKGGNGVTLQIAERLDQAGDNALFIEFGPGRVEFGGVSQLVLLPPGNYQLQGKHKSDLVSQRGLQWRILCGSRSIGESRAITGTEPTWNEFAVSFTVPEDCPTQTIKLALDARSASETFVSGSIWYDALSIARALEVEPSGE